MHRFRFAPGSIGDGVPGGLSASVVILGGAGVPVSSGEVVHAVPAKFCDEDGDRECEAGIRSLSFWCLHLIWLVLVVVVGSLPMSSVFLLCPSLE